MMTSNKTMNEREVPVDTTKTHLRLIESLNRKVLDRRAAWDNAKAAASAYKKEYDEAVEELVDTIAGGNPVPLFAGAEKDVQ